jgi:hypothetical protein
MRARVLAVVVVCGSILGNAPGASAAGGAKKRASFQPNSTYGFTQVRVRGATCKTAKAVLTRAGAGAGPSPWLCDFGPVIKKTSTGGRVQHAKCTDEGKTVTATAQFNY